MIKRKLIIIIIACMPLIAWWFCLPKPLFDSSYSTVLVDKNDQLLGARLAQDGQWRFPGDDLEMPETFKQAIIHFEDKRFRYHNGIDLLAVGRAVRDNLSSGGIKSGGS